jgi:hypothetical protein
LIASTAILPTAPGPFSIGADDQSFLRRVQSHATTRWQPITSINNSLSLQDAAHDVTIMWLDDSIVHEALPVRPMGAAPGLKSTTVVWMAGWSRVTRDGYDDPVNLRYRTVASFPGSAVAFRAQSAGEGVWHTTSSEAGVQSGDSGGPLFSVASNGERRVFGVLSEASNDHQHSYHADITTAPAVAWLNNTLLDKNHGGERQQGIDRFAALYHQDWYTFHGKDPNAMWYGETDYVGPCQNDPQDPLHRDQDCDGWWDGHDTCPSTPNTSQVPGDEADLDADGVCDIQDNCPKAYNPDQNNCNKEFEDSQLQATLGDACDPVPCPRTVSDPYRQVGHWNIQECKVKTIRLVVDNFTIAPLGPHKRDDFVAASTPAAIPLPGNVDTTARFCQTVYVDHSLDKFVSCTSSTARKPLKQVRLPESTRPDGSAPWHRITLTDSSDHRYLPVGSGIPLHYADGVTQKVTWNYLEDNVRWHDGGTDVVGSNKPGDLCSTDRAGVGTCLDGWMWLHADTTFGSDDTVANSKLTVGGVTHILGSHGPGLSDTTFKVVPDLPLAKVPCAPILIPCAAGDGGCIRDLFLDPDYCPNCSLVLTDIAKDKMRVPVVNARGTSGPGAFAVLWNDLAGRVSELGLPSAVASALRYNFVSSQRCESTPDNAVSAVALPSGSGKSQYLVASSSSPGGFLVRDSAVSNPGSTGLTTFADPRTARDRVDPKVVFSVSANGAYILGGTDATNGLARTDVQFEPIDGRLRTLPGRIPESYGTVLAATINGDELWTVEQVPPPPGGPAINVNVVARTITTSSVSSPMYTTTLTLNANEYPGVKYMLSAGCETAGRVVLSLSDPSQNRWAAFEVERGSVRPLADGGGFADGALFQAPRLDKDVLIIPIVKAGVRTPFVANVPRTRIISRPTIDAWDVYSEMR